MMKSLLTASILIAFILPGFSQENSDFKGNHPNVHKIVVKEVLQTTSYTYVHAEENGELQWMAVPIMEANVGDTYYYQGGMQIGD